MFQPIHLCQLKRSFLSFFTSVHPCTFASRDNLRAVMLTKEASERSIIAECLPARTHDISRVVILSHWLHASGKVRQLPSCHVAHAHEDNFYCFVIKY
jgi:hypothetical protein